MAASMGRYRVDITHKGKVVQTCEVPSAAMREAVDQAWRAFDPDRKIDIFDTRYDTHVEEL
jgi:hypothetical protein